MTLHVINTGNVGGTDDLLRSVWTQLQASTVLQHLWEDENVTSP